MLTPILALLLATTPDLTRTVLLGDSITFQSYLSAALETTTILRHPTIPVALTSLGYSGFTALGGAAHVSDALFFHPTTVIVEYGANDSRDVPWKQVYQDNYIAGLSSIITQLRAADPTIGIIVLSPPATDPHKWTGVVTAATRNDALTRISAAAQTWAQGASVTYIDITAPLITVFTSTAPVTWTFDGIHPTFEGAIAFTAVILQALGEAGPISTASINAVTYNSPPYGPSLTAQTNTTISNITGDNTALLSFDRLDAGQPLVIPLAATLKSDILKVGSAAIAAQYVPGWVALNRVGLQVTNLVAGTWRVFEDGVQVTSATATQLAAGIDLQSTPAAALTTATVLGRTKQSLPPNGAWERNSMDSYIAGQLFGSGSFWYFAAGEGTPIYPQRNAYATALKVATDGWRTAYVQRAQPVTHKWKLVRP